MKTGENIFSVANFLETHGTECDNSPYISSKNWLASLADYLSLYFSICFAALVCFYLNGMR